jgi:quinoprotein dehydrogenase-associated probable ABC transporter substrate-binding protein
MGKHSSLVAGAIFVGALATSVAASAGELESLTVCADPGNMPLSNRSGEGFENKIAEVIGAELGTGVQYYWRPSIERGLMRTTLSEGDCDVWMNMASGTEGATVLAPLYRSTFVLAYRSDKGMQIKSLEDPALKKLRIGVFQVSAIRQALAEHGVVNNTVIHYLSHNADIELDNQPSRQVQQVIDGSLDVAAVWGPMAGYYQKVLHASLVLVPTNLMHSEVPTEFDMTLAVARNRPDVKAAIETALAQRKVEIKQILVDFGVPLVQCDECVVSGDLPSHGSYEPLKLEEQATSESARTIGAQMANLEKRLAQGADPDSELNDAIVASDVERTRYLLERGAQINAYDDLGYSPLINAIRFGFVPGATHLIERSADLDLADRSGWTPLMWAVWIDNPAMVRLLIDRGARLDTADRDGLTALAIAAQNAKARVIPALLDGGADVNAFLTEGRYSPLMLASLSGSTSVAKSLIEHGADVNASNSGGVTALMIAAAGNHPAIAELLLASGADATARSQDGRTALSISRANHHEAVASALLGLANPSVTGPSK